MAKMMGAFLDQDGFRTLQDGTETVVYLGREARVLGAVSVADKLRETSAGALAALRASGVKTITMMTGDRRAVAARIGEALGLRPNEIRCRDAAADKVRLVGEMAVGGTIAFVGDGVTTPRRWRPPMWALQWERQARKPPAGSRRRIAIRGHG